MVAEFCALGCVGVYGALVPVFCVGYDVALLLALVVEAHFEVEDALVYLLLEFAESAPCLGAAALLVEEALVAFGADGSHAVAVDALELVGGLCFAEVWILVFCLG